MIYSSLQVFADRVLAKGRLGKLDVQELQRDLLADGLMSRHDAEILIRLDREAKSTHATWPAFFITMMTDFVVWGSRPTGLIDPDTAIWLATELRKGDCPRAARLVAELAKEAQEVDGALMTITAPVPVAAPLDHALAA